MAGRQGIAGWDATIEQLIAYADRARYGSLSPVVVHEVRRRLVDTFASALGAWDEPVSGMARSFASRYRGDDVARIWGSDRVTTPELAAFTNGVMTRALDVSDTYLGLSRGHPSDMTSGLVAVAEIVKADGRSLVAAISLAYDLYCSFCQTVDLNAKGWDQPVYGILGCVVGCARLLDLTPDQTGHAIALALVPNMALAQSRRGDLSSWKGCAGANASRNAVFAALLAREGFTGPGAAFDGSGGLREALGGFDWTLPHAPMIGQTHTKSLPVCYHGQSAVLAAIELRSRVDLARIVSIDVDAYGTAVFMMGADDSRWAPATRETADHSLPYCVAVALLDGQLEASSFDERRLADPAIRALMCKVKVAEDPVLSSQYPEGAPGRVTLHMDGGEALSVEIRYPKGHWKAPMCDEELVRKFRQLGGERLGVEGCDRALEALWAVESIADVNHLTRLMCGQ